MDPLIDVTISPPTQAAGGWGAVVQRRAPSGTRYFEAIDPQPAHRHLDALMRDVHAALIAPDGTRRDGWDESLLGDQRIT